MLGAISVAVLGAAVPRAAAEDPDGVLVGSFFIQPSPYDPEFQFVGACELRAVDPRSGRQTVLRPPRHKNDCAKTPALSPRGDWLAYTTGRGDDDARADLWVRRLDTGTETRLAVLSDERYMLSWSPDGALLAVAPAREPARRWLVIDPGAMRSWDVRPCVARLNPGSVFRWRLDGNGFLAAPDDASELVECSLAGARRVLLARLDPEEAAAAAATDVVAHVSRGERPAVVVIPLAGGAPETVPLPFVLKRLMVSPGGRWIGGFGDTDETQREELFVVGVAGAARRSLGRPHIVSMGWSGTRALVAVDARRSMTKALGPGRRFRQPLTLNAKRPLPDYH